MCQQPRPGTRRGRRRRPRTLLLHDQLFLGRESELGGRPLGGRVDVSGPSIFSHWDAWHPARSTLPERFSGRLPRGKSRHAHFSCTWAGVILDLCQRGLVQMALMVTVGLSGYLRPSEMFNFQGGDIQAPGPGVTTHSSLLLFPEERSGAAKLAQATTACFWTCRGCMESSPCWLVSIGRVRAADQNV